MKLYISYFRLALLMHRLHEKKTIALSRCYRVDFKKIRLLPKLGRGGWGG